ncbi:MAG: lysylphosphatidylglycerol synthase domain-containing protein [Lapillicoccus sp.]
MAGPLDATPDPSSDLSSPRSQASTLRKYAGLGLMILVVGAALWAIGRNGESVVETVRRVGAGGVLLSLGAGLIGIGATGVQWRTVLDGLGVHLAGPDAVRVFFVSQLGKYLPGSVWPIVMQMEAGRERGASRKTVLAGNVITLAISLTTGLVLAGLLLPFAYPEALQRYWWALAALPLVIVLALPQTLPFLLDKALRLVRRPPLGVQMTVGATLRASAWSVVSWVGLGVHLAVLASAVNGFTPSLLALGIGGMALAVTAGVLFIPSPAGAGLREVVLGFVLVAVMTSGQAVAVVVASRVLLILTDLILAGAAAMLGARSARRRPVRSASAGEGSTE